MLGSSGQADVGGHRVKPYAGFTLIETLLVMTLAGMALAAASQVLLLTVQTQAAARDAVDRQDRRSLFWELFEADLEAQIETDRPIGLAELDTHHRPVLRIRCLADVPGGSLHVVRLPAEVRYRIVRLAGAEQEYSIQRIVTWLVEAPDAGPWVETVAEKISGVDVELLVRGTWEPLSSKTDGLSEGVRALRLTVRYADDGSSSSRMFLVAGVPERANER